MRAVKLTLFALLVVVAPAWAQGQQSVPTFRQLNLSTYVIPASVVDGGGGFTPQLFGPLNCSTAPAYSFAGLSTYGFGMTGVAPCVVVAGVATTTFAAATTTTTVPFVGPAGAGNSPTFRDANLSGLYFPTTNYAGLSGGAIGIVAAANDGATNALRVRSDTCIGWSSSTSLTASSDISFCRIAAGVAAPASGQAYGLASKALINTAPSGPVACTSPTITWSNGTAAFQIDVGSTCAAVSTLVVTLPAVSNAYSCTAINTTTSATAAVEMTASTTTTATFTNFTRTTGLALAWVDGADIRISCLGG